MEEQTKQTEQQPNQEQGTDTQTTEKQTDNQQAKPDAKLLSQEEVNKIVQGIKAKFKEKYADYDDLKAKLEAYEKAQKEKEEAELSELEKAQRALAEKDEALAALQKQIEEAEAKARERAIKQAFKDAARAADIQYVDDALALADLSGVEVDGDEVKGIDEVIAKLVETKPFLVAKKQVQNPVGGPTNGKGDKKAQASKEELLKAAAEKARQSGRLEDKIAYAQLKRELSRQ